METTPVELRCQNKLHGIILGETFEAKCDSRFCGAGNGWVVFHTISTHSGEVLKTERYKNPPTRRED